MEITIRWYILVFSLVAGPGFGRDMSIDTASHREEITRWQQRRLAGLTRDDGWLTLCGLFWLKEGANTVGTDSASDVVLPQGKARARVGVLFLATRMPPEMMRIRFKADPHGEVRHGDSIVTSINLSSDESRDGPTILRHGTISFYVIKRGTRFGVRVKDSENPARVNFRGLRYFPVDVRWRFDAVFKPYEPPRVLTIASAGDFVEDYPCPGALVFEFEGRNYRVDAVIETGAEDRLFIMFNDRTSGKETYGGGRQLYTRLPDSTGHVVLDFNMAYNWPCVFTTYATCPIPPPQNRLPVGVEAGEMMYEEHDQVIEDE